MPFLSVEFGHSPRSRAARTNSLFGWIVDTSYTAPPVLAYAAPPRLKLILGHLIIVSTMFVRPLLMAYIKTSFEESSARFISAPHFTNIFAKRFMLHIFLGYKRIQGQQRRYLCALYQGGIE
jgi:hypothetical protein